MFIETFRYFIVLFTLTGFLILSFSLFVYFLLLFLTSLQSMIGGSPFVPLERDVAEKMLDLAGPEEGDIIFDLGCGDGRHLILSYFRYKTKGVGIEIAMLPYLRALWLRKVFNLESEIKLVRGNIKTQDISSASVVFVYLLEPLLNSLVKKLKSELKPGTKIVSARYMIKGLPLKQTLTDSKHPIYLYEV